MLSLHMVLPKQPMLLLCMVQKGLANGFKTMCKASYTTHGFIVHGLGGHYKWFEDYVQGLLNNPWFQESLANGFKTMYGDML